MATYKYMARNQEGVSVSGKISADNESMIVAELRKRNLIIISINEEKTSRGHAAAPKIKKGKKVKSEELVIFTRQFATMVDAGIPILQALEALGEQASSLTFKQVLTTIREDIQLGSNLAVAFSKHPQIFDQLYVNMLKVGETGGVLSTILERTSIYLEKTEKLKQKVKAAMIYPSVVVTMALAITTVLIVKVVPIFATIYDSLGQQLPVITQLLINLSQFMQKKFFLLVVGVTVIIFGFIKYRQTPSGRLWTDTLALRLPIFGDLVCKVSVSRFSRTFATLSQSGVSILETLDIVEKSCGNRVLELLVDDIKTSVKQGESMAVPLSKSKMFPAMVTRMIAIGEKSGQLEKMLSKVAEFYDEQVDTAVESLTKLIEPLIIAFLGIVVGFIVVALFMPILTLTRALHV